MKLYTRLILSGLFLLAITFGFAACSSLSGGGPALTPEPATATVAPAPTNVPATATPAVPALEIIGVTETKAFSLADLKTLPVTEGYAGIKSSTGKITPPVKFKGVALKDLAALVGGIDQTNGLNIFAKDGYSITFSYDQAINGKYIQYDPATGDELKNPVALTTIIAYEQDGKPIDPNGEGPLRLVIISAEQNQVTDGHWAVKWTTKIALKSLVEEWTLAANGGIKDTIERATFESCSAPQCHGVTWTDDKAQDWVGVPLFILVGGVDDAIKHEGPAFNDALAAAGYKVDVIAKDGYTVTFDSKRMAYNRNIIIAHSVNGNPLDEKYFPLRLVGSDLQKNEMVGAITEIKVGVELAPTAQPTAAEAGTIQPGTLVITGMVNQTLTLNEPILRAMKTLKVNAENSKKKVKEDYEGVSLNALLDSAGLKDGATKLVVTAADGFTAEVNLSDVRSCPNAILAFTDTPGKWTLILPDLPSSSWVKEVVKIEVK
jgi:DMSO/TMAO reductase YedYZ molybdopterin-dependent catalytic subunit